MLCASGPWLSSPLHISLILTGKIRRNLKLLSATRQLSRIIQDSTLADKAGKLCQIFRQMKPSALDM